VVPSLLTLVVSLIRWIVSPSLDTASRPKICQIDMVCSLEKTFDAMTMAHQKLTK
jgi:hypothetical protein